MTALYGALAMFPLGWAFSGYALVSRPGAPKSTTLKGTKE
jgi:hypothetical protein